MFGPLLELRERTACLNGRKAQSGNQTMMQKKMKKVSVQAKPSFLSTFTMFSLGALLLGACGAPSQGGVASGSSQGQGGMPDILDAMPQGPGAGSTQAPGTYTPTGGGSQAPGGTTTGVVETSGATSSSSPATDATTPEPQPEGKNPADDKPEDKKPEDDTPQEPQGTCGNVCTSSSSCGAGESCVGTNAHGRYCRPTSCVDCWRQGGVCDFDQTTCEVRSCQGPEPVDACTQPCQTNSDCGERLACMSFAGQDTPICAPLGCDSCLASGELCTVNTRTCRLNHCGEPPPVNDSCYSSCETDAQCGPDQSCLETTDGKICISTYCNHCFANDRLCATNWGDCAFVGCAEKTQDTGYADQEGVSSPWFLVEKLPSGAQ